MRGTNQTFQQISFPYYTVSFHLFLCFLLFYASNFSKPFYVFLGGITELFFLQKDGFLTWDFIAVPFCGQNPKSSL